MTAIRPATLGLPPTFEEFRPGQLAIALDIASGEERFHLLTPPPGAGKSLIYVAVSCLLDARRTLVLTATKGLQHQLIRDFAGMGMVDVRGQANYRCVAVDKGGELSDYGTPGDGCDDGPCHVGVRCGLREEPGCLYYDAVRQAARARMVVTNYAYWLSIGRFADADAIGKFDLLVLDEAHRIPDLLSSFCAVTIRPSTVRALLDIDTPSPEDAIDVWVEWANMALERAKAETQELRRAIADIMQPHTRRDNMRTLFRIVRLARDLQEVAGAHAWRRSETAEVDARVPGAETDWVVEREEGRRGGTVLTPVWAHSYAELYLYRGVPKVVLSSATMRPAMRPYLAVGEDESAVHTLKSTFPRERRPIHFLPGTPIDYRSKTGDVRRWVAKIDRIIEGRLDRKGIVHCRSYKWGRRLVEMSRFASHMIHHGPGDGPKAIGRFRGHDAPAVLVSPAIVEGVDFPYDVCSYQIVAKLPFADTRGAVMKARVASDKEYTTHLAVQTLVQSVGRGMRAADDSCETFIVDGHWAWWYRRQARRFPRWFRQAYRRWDAGKIPPPLRL